MAIASVMNKGTLITTLCNGCNSWGKRMEYKPGNFDAKNMQFPVPSKGQITTLLDKPVVGQPVCGYLNNEIIVDKSITTSNVAFVASLPLSRPLNILGYYVIVTDSGSLYTVEVVRYPAQLHK